MKNWNLVENKQTYRIVLSDFGQQIQYGDASNYADLIMEWLLWRNYQYLNPQNLTVVKIGHGEGFKNPIYLEILLNLLKKDLSFIDGSMRFAIYHYFENKVEEDLYFKYIDIINCFQNNRFNFCLSTIINLDLLEKNHITIEDILVFLQKNKENNINNVILLNNLNYAGLNTIDLLKKINQLDLAVGYDVAGKKSNLSIELNENNKKILDFFNLINGKIDFIDKVMPEYVDFKIKKRDDFNLVNEINKQVELFINDGFLIDSLNKDVSPLIYGSADDFTLFSKIKHQDLILLTKDEIYSIYTKEALKLFGKNYCLYCSFALNCSEKRIWWLNMIEKNKKECDMKLEQFLK
jgi:hypothetical protein